MQTPVSGSNAALWLNDLCSKEHLIPFFWGGGVLSLFYFVVLFSAAAATVGLLGLLSVPWDFFYLKRTSAFLH